MTTIRLVALVIIVTGAAAAAQRQQAPPPPKAPVTGRGVSNDQLSRERQRDIARSEGLRAAAALTGKYETVTRSHPERPVQTLDKVVGLSQLVVVGTIRSARGFVDAREHMVYTSYEVEVEDVVKGPPQSSTVVVSIKGGRAGFPDGSYAHVATPEMALPIPGERYVFFLQPARYETSREQRQDARGPIYTPTFDSVGVFLITRGAVQPRGPRTNPVRAKYAGKSLQAFTVAIRSVGR